MIKKTNMKKTIGIVLILLFVVSGVTGSTIGWQDNCNEISYDKNSLNNEETVWWNTTEFSTESYTSPFFSIYNLIELGQAAYGLDTVDFNNDGLLDFIVSYATSPFEFSSISIFYNTGNNSFIRSDISIKIYSKFIRDVDTADFDGDGDNDIMFTYNEVYAYQNWNGTVNILWNDNGQFEEITQIVKLTPFGPVNDKEKWINLEVSSADFDRDGDIDFIVGGNCGRVKLFKNNGAGNFTDEGVIFDYGDVSWGMDTGDFNKDGYPDFIVSARTNSDEYPFQDAGHIYLKLNDQTSSCFDNTTPGELIASLPPAEEDAINAAPRGTLAFFDYNDDNKLDILYGSVNKVFFYINEKNSFRSYLVARLPNNEEGYLEDLCKGDFCVGDFNSDGMDDAAVGGVQGIVRLFINNETLIHIDSPPDRWLVVFGEKKMHLHYPGDKIVIGDMEVIASGLEPLSRVDFYLDDELVHSDHSEPFSWNWTRFGFREYKVTVEAYDGNGEFAGRDIIWVWKFL